MAYKYLYQKKKQRRRMPRKYYTKKRELDSEDKSIGKLTGKWMIQKLNREKLILR